MLWYDTFLDWCIFHTHSLLYISTIYSKRGWNKSISMGLVSLPWGTVKHHVWPVEGYSPVGEHVRRCTPVACASPLAKTPEQGKDWAGHTTGTLDGDMQTLISFDLAWQTTLEAKWTENGKQNLPFAGGNKILWHWWSSMCMEKKYDWSNNPRPILANSGLLCRACEEALSEDRSWHEGRSTVPPPSAMQGVHGGSYMGRMLTLMPIAWVTF